MLTTRLWASGRPFGCSNEDAAEAADLRATPCPPGLARLFAPLISPEADAPLVVVLSADSRAPLGRLLAWLSLPFRIRRAEQLMARSGGAAQGCYAIFPSLDAPVIAYELRTTAARYAEARLLGHGDRRLAAVLRSIASRLVGCDPSIETVVVVGRPDGAGPR